MRYCIKMTEYLSKAERINASGLEGGGVNRPAKQTQPISAQTPEPPGFSLEPPGKCTSVYFPGASGNSFLCRVVV
jgi:hypothetical protein